MSGDRPKILASTHDFYWSLAQELSFDTFSWQAQGSAALLLLGMHLIDSKPWIAARHPLILSHLPGIIDQEAKRILGKRYRVDNTKTLELPLRPLDPIAATLELIESQGHNFTQPDLCLPDKAKEPGKLLPRKLFAQLNVVLGSQSFQLYSRNFSELSQCLHAELTLLFALSRALEPIRSSHTEIDSFCLETTLKPCKMCAAFLHAIRPLCRDFRVIYEQDDPGRLASDTLLDQFGYY